MKYFIIEISKPYSNENYRVNLREKINNLDFEVVRVCDSLREAESETVKFQIKNAKNQFNKHYEIITGDGSEGFRGLQKELNNFDNRINQQIKKII